MLYNQHYFLFKQCNMKTSTPEQWRIQQFGIRTQSRRALQSAKIQKYLVRMFKQMFGKTKGTRC